MAVIVLNHNLFYVFSNPALRPDKIIFAYRFEELATLFDLCNLCLDD